MLGRNEGHMLGVGPMLPQGFLLAVVAFDRGDAGRTLKTVILRLIHYYLQVLGPQKAAIPLFLTPRTPKTTVCTRLFALGSKHYDIYNIHPASRGVAAHTAGLF